MDEGDEGRHRRTTALTREEEQRLREYRKRGTAGEVMRRTTWQFRLWTFLGFLTPLGLVALLLWWANVPNFDFVWRAVSIVLAMVYWPAIAAWVQRRERQQVDRT